jgi:hypothetical protein
VKVFISWSGEQSRQIALALHEWLPQALQAAKPYMSEKDNEAGGLWDYILSTELEVTDFGIVCLTPSNLESRWINFEAGALSKAVTKARVVPLLFRLKNADVGLPLSRFQMKPASREGILDTVRSINAHADPERKVDEAVLLGTFESVWPKLRAKLDAVPDGPEARVRGERELLVEILELVRASNGQPSVLSTGTMTNERISLHDLVRALELAGGPGATVTETADTITLTVPHILNLQSNGQINALAKDLRQHGMSLHVAEDISGPRPEYEVTER